MIATQRYIFPAKIGTQTISLPKGIAKACGITFLPTNQLVLDVILPETVQPVTCTLTMLRPSSQYPNVADPVGGYLGSVTDRIGKVMVFSTCIL